MAKLKVLKSVFQNGEQLMTILCAQGKSGYNVKASIKSSKDTKALTGARGNYADAAEAEAYYNDLVESAKKTGWKPKTVTSKNAFAAIPKPGSKESKSEVPVQPRAPKAKKS